MAINCGFTALEVKRSNRETLVELSSIQRPPSTHLWQLEAPLNCSPCNKESRWRVLV